MPPRSNTRPPGTKSRRSGPYLPGSLILMLIFAALVAALLMNNPLGSPQSIDYNDLIKLSELHNIKKITFVGKDRAVGEVKNNDDEFTKKLNLPNGRFGVTLPPANDRSPLADRILKDDPTVAISSEEEHGNWVSPILTTILMTMLLVGALVLFVMPRFRDPLGGGFLNSYIKSPARRYERTKGRITFEDVADMESAKSELAEVVEFLRNADKFQRLGARVPKGVLLVGPPGTGKTLLARAVAGEANVPFYSINGSEFIQMFVGVGASRVRDMFKTAKENAPCLLFIDEIDAVGRMRGAGVGGGSDEREQTLNQILSEMDGFQPSETVIVIAATNRPDVLDSALLRPGRFDRHVTVDRPTWKGRLEILKVHTRNKPLSDDVDLEVIARKMTGMTGADLSNLANEAALLATRENKHKIDKTDFDRAADRVLLGPKREELMTAEGKRKTAYHEAGHALVALVEPHADPPQRVTIVPRGRALGVTLSQPDEDRYHYGLDYWKARLAMMMGGRAADRLVFDQPFSGHEDDLKQATKLARYMVTHWGMSDRLGPMAFRIGEEHVFLGKEIQEARDFSEGVAQIIDEEVQKLLRDADERAFELLKEHRIELDRLVEGLLENEELDRKEIEAMLDPDTRSIKHSEHEEVVPPTPVLAPVPAVG
ncbi:MAG TPA: ATP-dependent zinc metalloprotease FtsH [Gemmataceae bacterium]|jgi:cell division protease FtsH|nr:ATP-dependent zinc metalloprotease FtsH [Gemmataceae bacterium]